jgi:hypothetical protein
VTHCLIGLSIAALWILYVINGIKVTIKPDFLYSYLDKNSCLGFVGEVFIELVNILIKSYAIALPLLLI